MHNLWNAVEVLGAARELSVVAYMNGHNHAGNYGRLDKRHFVTFSGMVDTTDGLCSRPCHKDRLEIEGFGGRKDDPAVPAKGD
ncbi:MAG: hypothetical protein CM1200mP29_13920 [Verrucomicrobiota bacterium]|nr:MAG: hypothetical protein CM1200mP29_13920 [Verrucomicrobiota bacterium]